MGSVAAMRGMSSKSKEYHNKSLSFDWEEGSSIDLLYFNYAGSLYVLKEFEEALDMGEKALNHWTRLSREEVVEFLAYVSFEVGDQRRYLHYVEEFERLTKKEHPSRAEYQALLDEANSLSDLCLTLTADTMQA